MERGVDEEGRLREREGMGMEGREGYTAITHLGMLHSRAQQSTAITHLIDAGLDNTAQHSLSEPKKIGFLRLYTNP